MVSPNNKTETGERTEKDVVCPTCFRPLPFPAVYSEGSLPVENGIKRRGYQGWCQHCDKNFMVIQWRDKDDRWKIEKYVKMVQKWHLSDQGWIIETPVNQPPVEQPPLVQTGPGGDYTKSYNESEIDAAIKTTQNMMMTIVNMIGELNRTMKMIVMLKK